MLDWFATFGRTVNLGAGALTGFRCRCGIVGRYADGGVSMYGVCAVGMGGSGWGCPDAVGLGLTLCEDAGDGNGFRPTPVPSGTGNSCTSSSYSEVEPSS